MGFWQRIRELLREEGPFADAARLRALELDLSDRDETIRRLKQEITRLRKEQKPLVEELTRARLKEVFSALATPLSQLMTQRYLIEEGKEVSPSEVMKLVSALERVLAQHGLEPVGRVGEVVSYDPSFHQLLSPGEISPGDRVRVKLVGFAFEGQLLRKAQVSTE